jgi:hypothetical protein
VPPIGEGAKTLVPESQALDLFDLVDFGDLLRDARMDSGGDALAESLRPFRYSRTGCFFSVIQNN